MLIYLGQLFTLLLELVAFLHKKLLALHENLHFVFHGEDPLLGEFREGAEGLSWCILSGRHVCLSQIEKRR